VAICTGCSWRVQAPALARHSTSLSSIRRRPAARSTICWSRQTKENEMDLIFLIGVVLILGFVLVTTIKGHRRDAVERLTK